LAHDEKASLPLRRAAIEGLAVLGGQVGKDTLASLAEKGDLTLRRSALVALAGLDLNLAVGSAPSVLGQAKDGAGSAEVFTAFLERKGGAARLAKALEGKSLPADVAKVGVRTARVSGRPAPELVEALTKAGGLTAAARVLSPTEMRQMVADVASAGDPSRGEKVFRRADQLCLKCHAIGGAGGLVGPDLSSIGAAAQVDYLIESLLLPSKAIKENYHSLLVTTTKGQQLTGIQVRRTPAALVLRNDQDREVAVPLRDIDEQTPSKSSLMPEGLADTLTRAELVDLARFLSELGKGERWSVGRAKVARRWEALQPNAEVYRLLNRLGMNALAAERPGLAWEPAYATVAGALPVGELPRFRLGKDGPVFSLVRTQFDAATASKARLNLSGVKGLTLWLDGEPLTPAAKVDLAMTAGTHTLTAVINHREAGAALRVEVEDTPAAAGVRFVGGK
jgi:putative heme-binding domain-containing protein